MIVNHTADFDDLDLRRMAAKVYPLFDDVVYRDPISVERWGPSAVDASRPTRRSGSSRRREVVGRRSPAAPPTSTSGRTRPRSTRRDPYLCIGGSSILWADWNPPTLARGFAALVEAVHGVYAGQIVLTASDIPDQKVFERVAAGLGLPLVGVTTPVQQAVDIVGNADAYIGGRWHPAIFALRAERPSSRSRRRRSRCRR